MMPTINELLIRVERIEKHLGLDTVLKCYSNEEHFANDKPCYSEYSNDKQPKGMLSSNYGDRMFCSNKGIKERK